MKQPSLFNDGTLPKTYGVIIADCPWKYSNKQNGAAENHYPVMTDAEIMALQIPAATDSVLFFWATWPMLPVAMKVIEAWGFSYISGFPWIKMHKTEEMIPAYGTGYWVRGCSEMVLIARKGKPRAQCGGYIGLICDRMKHSRKPDSIYELAEVHPGPYLEMFARRDRENWDHWGNELENSAKD